MADESYDRPGHEIFRESTHDVHGGRLGGSRRLGHVLERAGSRSAGPVWEVHMSFFQFRSGVFRTRGSAMGRISGVCSVLIGFALLMAGCSQQGLTAPSQTGRATNVSGMRAAGAPATPPFNLEAVLRDVNDEPGFGLVKFRQPKDAELIVYLDAWVRDLSPHT